MTERAIEILLVEDNPDDVQLTMSALKKNKLSNQVHIARDGQEALDFIFGAVTPEGDAHRDHPKVILLDLKLPKIDGLEVLQRVKSDPHTRSIPIVMLTSSREERDIVESYSLGVNSYIVKPVDFDQLTDAIRDIGLYWMILNQPPERL
jgi:CheY-like chemotaxis protein